MLLDNQLMFSDAQALIATAVSTNVIDMGVSRDLGAGEPFWVQFTFGAVTSNATWNAAFKGSNTADMTTDPAITKFTTPTVTPVANSMYLMRVPPGIAKRYYRIDYTMSGGTSPSITTTATLVKDSMIKPFSRALLGV
jgi:hypothetical protein